MKNIKNLTVKQKRLLAAEGLEPKDFKLERATSKLYVFINVNTGEILKREKESKR